MKQLIPVQERSTKRCHYCNTWVSVRWKIPTEELDRVYYGANRYVCCCGRCADKHYISNED